MAQTTEAELVRCARNVARMQTRRARLRREIKKLNTDLRTERKHLRALLGTVDREPDVMPSRIFGPGVGRKIGPIEPRPRPAESGDAAAFVNGLDDPQKGGVTR